MAEKKKTPISTPAEPGQRGKAGDQSVTHQLKEGGNRPSVPSPFLRFRGPAAVNIRQLSAVCGHLFATKEHLYRWILVLLPVRPKKFPGKSLSILCVLSLTTVRPRW